MKRILLLISGVLVLLLGIATETKAQTPTADEVNAVAAELYCPLCAGLRLDVCELKVCEDMRQEIAERLAAGQTPEEIKAYFAEQYGPKVLGAPEKKGWGWLVWLFPIVLALAAGLGVLWWWRQRFNGERLFPTTSPVVGDIAVDDADLERVERELEALESE
ncbi:cytochrome c-type biogenesis protein CcmH [Ardenticatena maritima]|uniref:Cytochrome c-type biogenesis protein n=1 Tax=Ardenticatena maritima TaxID=872965 RepID=A0A0M8K9Z0_9CHLR|nr:cytochrome c-type biogenesis protein CcmH [Ardenticatena maritima]GAP63479.1 cytochrome c-type biogenesis protein CcmH [Ardenticatena maritima]